MNSCSNCNYFMTADDPNSKRPCAMCNNPNNPNCGAHSSTEKWFTFKCNYFEKPKARNCQNCIHNIHDSGGPYCFKGNWHNDNPDVFKYNVMKCDMWGGK